MSGAPSLAEKEINEHERAVSDTTSVHNPVQEAYAPTKETPDGVTPAEAGAEVEKNAVGDDDETEYPSGFKLAMITIALCLSVFCMALVSSLILKCWSSH